MRARGRPAVVQSLADRGMERGGEVNHSGWRAGASGHGQPCQGHGSVVCTATCVNAARMFACPGERRELLRVPDFAPSPLKGMSGHTLHTWSLQIITHLENRASGEDGILMEEKTKWKMALTTPQIDTSVMLEPKVARPHFPGVL